jgi:hypothetical protein
MRQFPFMGSDLDGAIFSSIVALKLSVDLVLKLGFVA